MKLPPKKPRVFEVAPRSQTQHAEVRWDDLDEADPGEAGSDGEKQGGSLAEALTAMFGERNVSVADSVREEHSKDKWYAAHTPEVVVFAESTGDVSRLLDFAHQRRVPVTTRGAGIGYVGGCVPVKGGIVLSTARMNRILAIEPKDGVAVVQPGVITGNLQIAVRALG